MILITNSKQKRRGDIVATRINESIFGSEVLDALKKVKIRTNLDVLYNVFPTAKRAGMSNLAKIAGISVEDETALRRWAKTILLTAGESNAIERHLQVVMARQIAIGPITGMPIYAYPYHVFSDEQNYGSHRP